MHNLYAGQICKGGWSERFTPFHFPHSTQVAGIMTTMEGDDRWLNKVFLMRAAPEFL
ncbi:hypothetical protein [Lunatimonas salinarum]|uniref:hypothetical protein n=1 Tax=Lunatimonas salinarum TaxID=1774590 RepID=UPI001ADF9D34|nr:hypothetical protein [Lunatimonas salinarum]